MKKIYYYINLSSNEILESIGPNAQIEGNLNYELLNKSEGYASIGELRNITSNYIKKTFSIFNKTISFSDRIKDKNLYKENVAFLVKNLNGGENRGIIVNYNPNYIDEVYAFKILENLNLKNELLSAEKYKTKLLDNVNNPIFNSILQQMNMTKEKFELSLDDINTFGFPSSASVPIIVPVLLGIGLFFMVLTVISLLS